MEQFVHGAHVPLEARQYVSGALTDADTYTISIEDPSGQLIIDATAMTPSGSGGIYTYEYGSSGSSVYGVYKADAVLTKGGVPRIDRLEFEIIKEEP